MVRQINSRIILKHDSKENWDKVANFIPEQGEIIIYDKDDNYPCEKIKIGDGKTFVKDLPFIEENLKEQILSQIDIIKEEKMNKMDYLGPVIKEGKNIIYKNGIEGLNISPTTYFSFTQSGTGEPSPENIRPISGWDVIQLNISGKNMLKPPVKRVALDFNTGKETSQNISSSAATDFIPWNENIEVIISGLPDTINNCIFFYDKNKNYISRMSGSQKTERILNNETKTNTNEVIQGVSYIRLSLYSVGTTGSIDDIDTAEMQMELGTVSTEYEPYSSNAFSLKSQFNETVYGGKYDWTTGLLTVDKKMVVVKGNETVIRQSQNNHYRFYINTVLEGIRPASGANLNLVCSHYMTDDAPINSNAVNNTISGFSNSSHAYVRDDAYESAEAYKAYLAEQYAAGTPVTIVYELAEPYTIQLAPQQIYALQGYNVLFGSGDNIKAIFNTSGQVYSLENISGLLPIEKGGTGASTSAAARTALGVTAQNIINSIDGLAFNSAQKAIRYAVCSTEDTVSAKTATVTAGDFKLENGARITVKFSYTNNTKIPTLNINQTGDKEIRWRNKTLTYWHAGSILDFIYDGSYWQLIGTVSPIQILPSSLGVVAGKTILEFRSLLDEWLEEASTYVGASTYFSASSEWETLWNNENTTELLSAGSYWLLTIRSYYPSGGTNFVLLEINSYYDKCSWFLAKKNGVWQKIQKTIFLEDLSNFVIDGGTWT